MEKPKTIQLFLMDGTVQGRMKATLRNWTGITYFLPRITLEKSRTREDLKQSGVYFLLGRDDDDRPIVYVGQARGRKNDNGVLGRIREHERDVKKGYWTLAIALVAADDSLGPTEISYLESRFHRWISAARRYTLMNANEPPAGGVPEEKKAELDEFMEYSRVVIGAMGYKMFEPVDDSKTVRGGEAGEDLILRMRGADARGRKTSDGFVVLAGSRVVAEEKFTRSAPANAKKNRVKYRGSIGPDMMLTEDVLFSTPSAAASFVAGASLSGPDSWRDGRGVSLKDLEGSEDFRG
ncbi:GIY-YIG nuclease family protein [Corynebacterium lowii]|uniref:GIY-YIG domain-containing protein n=1 Tax=Corynebacterium lowii TaxID=1544413 RepID=A0A0Q0UEG1_9CORY|nr:GIY-YIG nuclease family protein [Corynebacterium lowii]KQB86254.1 hypothetical protein Clow_01173 [Corynebacterium lowii]MDP9850739.1 hypothetical protein [Corynebacterium lowii]